MKKNDDITQLLARCREADEVWLNQTWEALHPVLARISWNILHQFVRGGERGASLSATDLLHQAYPRLARRLSDPESPWRNRVEFYAFARRAMLYEFLDYQRDGRRHQPDLHTLAPSPKSAPKPFDIEKVIDLETALDRLRINDPEIYKVLSLRFLEDYSVDQVVDLTGLSRYKVLNRGRLGLAYLRGLLAERKDTAFRK